MKKINKKIAVSVLVSLFTFLFLSTAQANLDDFCYDFEKDLVIGSAGEQVQMLQRALQKEGFLDDYEKRQGEYSYWKQTLISVGSFVNNYNLSTGDLVHDIGIKFTDSARRKMNDLYGCQVKEKPFPGISIIYPDGGEIFEQNTEIPIFWESRGVENVKIDLVDYGSAQEWGNIPFVLSVFKAPASDGSWAWRIRPDWPTGDLYKIRVSDLQNPYIYGESSDYFTIINPEKESIDSRIDFISPAKGERWEKGEQKRIEYTTKNVDKVIVSLDNLTDFGETETSWLIKRDVSIDGNNTIYWDVGKTEFPPEDWLKVEEGRYRITIKDSENYITRSSSEVFWIIDKEGPKIEKPTVVTRTPDESHIRKTRASVRGAVLDMGGANEFKAAFRYGKDGNLDGETGWITLTRAGYPGFVQHISGLTPGTEYQYKVVAKNEAGKSYGDIVSFMTEEGTGEDGVLEISKSKHSPYHHPHGVENRKMSSVQLSARNTGETELCQEVVYDAGFGKDVRSFCVGPENTMGLVLRVMPQTGDAGTYIGRAYSEDDSVTIQVDIYEDMIYKDSAGTIWTPTLNLPADGSNNQTYIWSNYCYDKVTGCDSNTDGESNTQCMLANCYDRELNAAEQCSNLNYAGYNDWYLPAIDDLKLLYEECPDNQVSGSNCLPGYDENAQLNTYYWSSTEDSNYHAKLLDFRNGEMFSHSKPGVRSVRCIRSTSDEVLSQKNEKVLNREENMQRLLELLRLLQIRQR